MPRLKIYADEMPGVALEYPRIQILSIEEILHGKPPEMPPQRSPFAEAPVEREEAKTRRML